MVFVSFLTFHRFPYFSCTTSNPVKGIVDRNQETKKENITFPLRNWLKRLTRKLHCLLRNDAEYLKRELLVDLVGCAWYGLSLFLTTEGYVVACVTTIDSKNSGHLHGFWRDVRSHFHDNHCCSTNIGPMTLN